MILNLTEITFYIALQKDNEQARDHLLDQQQKLGINLEFIPAVESNHLTVNKILDQLKILELPDLTMPFAIITPDFVLKEGSNLIYDIPDDTDAFYLGQSRFGIDQPGQFSYGKLDHIMIEAYNDKYIRLFNNLGCHGIVYLSKEYVNEARSALLDALTSRKQPYSFSIALAMTQKEALVLSPVKNISYQSDQLGGGYLATCESLYPRFITANE
jgi:hypothetical protein